MKHRKLQVTIYLNPEQVTALRALSKVTQVPQSIYIRQGIDKILKKNRNQISQKEK